MPWDSRSSPVNSGHFDLEARDNECKEQAFDGIPWQEDEKPRLNGQTHGIRFLDHIPHVYRQIGYPYEINDKRSEQGCHEHGLETQHFSLQSITNSNRGEQEPHKVTERRLHDVGKTASAREHRDSHQSHEEIHELAQCACPWSKQNTR